MSKATAVGQGMWRWLSRITTGLALGAFGTLVLFLLILTVGGTVFLLFWLQD